MRIQTDFCFIILNFIHKIPTGQTILLSPLDWGLGHATRCVPLIQQLIKQQNKVFVCVNDTARKIIESECPEATIIPFEGYHISYSRHPRWMMAKLLFQLPKIGWKAWREYHQLKQLVQSIKPDIIISDNRLGFRHKNIHSIYITHQLAIKTGNQLLDRIAQVCHYFYINRFHECWVPDYEGSNSLAGELSNPLRLPRIPVHYLGLLARFCPIETEKKYKAVIVLSGPEPQRSIFEKIILSQLNSIHEKLILVRGLPTTIDSISVSPNVTVNNYLSSNELNKLMQESHVVIARSGYSTIMDLAAIHQKAVLIPTPGQTEQEYLAKYLSKHFLFETVTQQAFCLSDILYKIKT